MLLMDFFAEMILMTLQCEKSILSRFERGVLNSFEVWNVWQCCK